MQLGRINDGERAEKVLDYYARLTPAERQELRRIRERKKGERLIMLGVFEEKSALDDRQDTTDFEKYLEAQAADHWSSWSKAEVRKLEDAIRSGRSWRECARLYQGRTSKAVRTKYYKVRAQLMQKGLVE